MECLITGCNFLLKNIPDEVFLYQRHGDPQYKLHCHDPENPFPYLLVNIGSGVSIVKVDGLHLKVRITLKDLKNKPDILEGDVRD